MLLLLLLLLLLMTMMMTTTTRRKASKQAVVAVATASGDVHPPLHPLPRVRLVPAVSAQADVAHDAAVVSALAPAGPLVLLLI